LTAEITGERTGDIRHIHLDIQIRMVQGVITATVERNVPGFTIILGIDDGQVVQNLLQQASARQS